MAEPFTSGHSTITSAILPFMALNLTRHGVLSISVPHDNRVERGECPRGYEELETMKS